MRSRAVVQDNNNNNQPEFNLINHQHNLQQQQQPMIRFNTITQNQTIPPSHSSPAIQASVSITTGNTQTNLAHVAGNEFGLQDIHLPGMQITLRPLNMTPSNNTPSNTNLQNNNIYPSSNYQQNFNPTNTLSNIASINLIVDNQPIHHNYASLANNINRPIFNPSHHHHQHHHPPTSPTHLEQMVTQNAVNMAIRHFQRSDPTLNINNPIHSNRFSAVPPILTNPGSNISPVTITTHLTNQPGPNQPSTPQQPTLAPTGQFPLPHLSSILSLNRHDLQNLHFRIPARILDRSLEVN
jgi:hypothetical protein